MMQKEKKRRKILRTGLCVILALLLLAAVGAGVLFREELGIIGTIRKESDEFPLYYMEVKGDYHFEEFLESGGAASDKEVEAFLTKCISKGFYQIEIEEVGPACSMISAEDENGGHVWGRNFDWNGSVPIIVKCIPEDGYASIATCDFKNITGSMETRPDNFINKMLAIAALYVPMDGVNEAGLCVADLEVNEGGMETIDTDKTDLTITNATRLILNKAATVEEAIEILEQYDIYASGGISHHLAAVSYTHLDVYKRQIFLHGDSAVDRAFFYMAMHVDFHNRHTSFNIIIVAFFPGFEKGKRQDFIEIYHSILDMLMIEYVRIAGTFNLYRKVTKNR